MARKRRKMSPEARAYTGRPKNVNNLVRYLRTTTATAPKRSVAPPAHRKSATRRVVKTALAA